MEIMLSEIAGHIGAALPEGREDAVIKGVAPLENAGEGFITFLAGEKHLKKLAGSKASAVLITAGLKAPVHMIPVYVDEPYYHFINVLALFNPRSPADVADGISPNAFIDETATLGHNVSVAPFAFIGKNVKIGDDSVIGPGTVILKDSELGTGCLLYPNVTIMDRCSVGNHVIIHSGAVIGADGFGFYPHKDELVKIPQTGGVRIGDNVEIGANTCVDRAVMGSTIIDSGVKLDNLVQIGHNAKIGANTVMASMAGISGSTEIGRGVRIGGQAGFGEHIKVGDGAGVAGQAGVTKDVPAGMVVSGYPAKDHMTAIKEEIHIRNLPKLKEKVKELEKRIAELEKIQVRGPG